MKDLSAIRPCWVEIDLAAVENNYRFLKTLALGAEVLAVVKADAYGHGLDLCGPAAVKAGAEWLGVTCVREGIAARAVCPDARIVALSGSFSGQAAAAIAHGVTPVVWEASQLGELEAAARDAGATSVAVHLELDTGMSRQGVSLDPGVDELKALLTRFDAASPLRLEGVVTHLFAADETDGHVNALQLERLRPALEAIAAAGFAPEWLSVGASAALLRGEAAALLQLAAHYGMRAMLRPGLALYGIPPEFVPDEPAAVTAAREQLIPVLSWKTCITSLRSIAPSAVVGYNGTFVATEPMRLALLPVGYADGLDRGLGNRFSLLVRGQRAPLVGRISMDLAVIDVTEIAGVEPGDEVVIIGAQAGVMICAADHAHAAGTIPWEILTRIMARVPRQPC